MLTGTGTESTRATQGEEHELRSGAPGGIAAKVSESGAQLVSLTLAGRERLWQADPRWWPRHAPVLFPIVGVVPASETCSRGACPMGRHGVARSQRFETLAHSEREASLKLVANDETRAAYPYEFSLVMTYEIVDDSTFRQTFKVRNLDTVDLPFTLGGHPAFNLLTAPDGSALPFEAHELRFAHAWNAATPTMDGAGMLDFGSMIELSRESDTLRLGRPLFDNDTLILHDVPDSKVELRARGSEHGVRLDFDGFEYLGVWSAAHAAPFLAIEPWTGCSTAYDEGTELERKRGMRLLAPGDETRFSFIITLW